MTLAKQKHPPILAIAGLVIVVVSLCGFLVWNGRDKVNGPESINSFQECADAGYPIMESYPEQCGVPGGKTFTNPEQSTGGGLVHPIAPNEDPLAQIQDEPITEVVPNPMSVVYLVQHRTALNGQTVTVNGDVVSTITPEEACPSNDQVGAPCAQPRITISPVGSTSSTAGVSNPGYNVEVIMENSASYEPGQTVIITAEVTADKYGINLFAQ